MSGLLVLLHGHGDQGRDMAEVAAALDPGAHWTHTLPTAPLRAEGGGRSWFRTGPNGPDPTTLADALARLDSHLEGRASDGRAGDRAGDPVGEVVVVGFSQGGAMALAWSLAGAVGTRLASVVCLSGYLPELDGLPVRWDRLAGVPVLVQHGRHDDVVPADFGADTAATLAHHGAEVTWQEHDGGHHPSEHSLAQVRTWLGEHATGSPLGAPSR